MRSQTAKSLSRLAQTMTPRVVASTATAIIVVLSFSQFTITNVTASKSHLRLLRDLMNKTVRPQYILYERPTSNDERALDLTTSFYLNQLMDLDEKNQVMSTIIWVKLRWQDYNFHWNPADYGGIESININPDAIWKPDILVYNCADDNFDRFYKVKLEVFYNSTVMWMPPGFYKSTCTINILYFPFDEQYCFIKFGTWTHTGEQITFRLSEQEEKETDQLTSNEDDVGHLCAGIGNVKMMYYVTNGEFNVNDQMMIRSKVKYACCPENYEDLTLFLKLQRRSLYYIFNLIVPCMIISAMALLVFILPPDSGEKVSLGVTILLSLTMFLQMVADKLPQTSESIPLISIYFSCTMILCSLSLVFTVLVLKYHHMSMQNTPSNFIRVVVNQWLATMVGYQPLVTVETSSVDLQTAKRQSLASKASRSLESMLQTAENPQLFMLSKLDQAEETAKKCNGHVMQLGSIETPNGPVNRTNKISPDLISLDEDFLVQPTISSPSQRNAFRLVQSSSEEDETQSDEEEEEEDSTTIGDEEDEESSLIQEADRQGQHQLANLNSKLLMEQAVSICEFKPDLGALLAELHLITDHLHEQDQSIAIANEWKFAAKVIDRVCLVIFTLAMLVVTLGTLFSAPKFLESLYSQQVFPVRNRTKVECKCMKKRFPIFNMTNNYPKLAQECIEAGYGS